MLTAVWTILIFCTIIFIHELGHFIAAKSVGVTVHEFSIGMGPKLFSRTKGETAYSVRLLPLGGFVRLEGEDDDSESDGALCNKKPWQKFVVLFAGGFMNFVLGFLVFIFLAANTYLTSNIIGAVTDGFSMQEQGFAEGDKIVAMEANGKSHRISSYNDIMLFLTSQIPVRTRKSPLCETAEKNHKTRIAQSGRKRTQNLRIFRRKFCPTHR
ncbi:MAG: site-2 protease family protein [Clostridiales bacterium]|nr:MAG: site-2 protease family protein [Clostridiales bacterium]